MIRLWYEFRAIGQPAFGILIIGALTALYFANQSTLPNPQARDLMIVLGTTLGLMLALLPTAHTDRALELTRNAAEAEGTRDLLHAGVSLFAVLVAFTMLLWVLHLPVQVLGWFPPRALWFGTVGAAVILAFRSTPLAIGAVALVFVLPYCPLPKEINPVLIQELRWQLHTLAAVLGMLVPFCVVGLQPRRSVQFLIATALGAFALLPLLVR